MINYPPEYYYTEELPALPKSTRPARLADFDRPKSEILGMRYYIKLPFHTRCTRYAVNIFTRKLLPLIANRLIWLDDPIHFQFNRDHMIKLARQYPVPDWYKEEQQAAEKVEDEEKINLIVKFKPPNPCMS